MVDILNTIRDLIISDNSISLPAVIGYGTDTPDDLIYMRRIDGDNSKTFFGTTSSMRGIYKPRFMITVRAKDYETAYNTAEAIKSKFIANKISDTIGIFMEGDIFDAGHDEIGRKQFELTYKSLINT